MAVRIDEAGQHRPAAEVFDYRAGRLLLHRLGCGTGEGDPAARHDHGFDVAGPVAFHRQDRATVDDEVS